MAEPKKWKDLTEFIFNTPLYEPIEVKEAWDAPGTHASPRQLISDDSEPLDGHCSACGKWSTFGREESKPSYSVADVPWSYMLDRRSSRRWQVTYACSRNPEHLIEIYLDRGDTTLEKVGQTPSLADTIIDEARKYTKALDESDRKELIRAIGLVAHGVGIGSFVYLRRLFERIIQRRFTEHSKEEGWADDAMNGMKMDDKIRFLSAYLPPFMVANRETYGMLSAGIHELDEETCLAMFGPLKTAIVFMLDEDEEVRRKKVAKSAAEAELKIFKQKLVQKKTEK